MIKADGLAAGKGVIIAHSLKEQLMQLMICLRETDLVRRDQELSLKSF